MPSSKIQFQKGMRPSDSFERTEPSCSVRLRCSSCAGRWVLPVLIAATKVTEGLNSATATQYHARHTMLIAFSEAHQSVLAARPSGSVC